MYRTFDLIETTNPLAKLRWQNIGGVWLLQVLTATVAELGPPLHTARDPSTCANWLHIVTCKFDAFQYCKLSVRKVILARKVKIQYNNYNGCKLKLKIQIYGIYTYIYVHILQIYIYIYIYNLYVYVNMIN